jgi:hypothetical protein
MKLYRQGLDYSILLKFLSHQSETNAAGSESTIEKRTASSKIVAGSMFSRDQRRFMIPPTEPITIPRNVNLTICQHIQFWSSGVHGYKHYYGHSVMEIASWRESRFYQNGNRLIKCLYCFTEFRIDFIELGKRGNAIYVTKWKDLGHCLSPLDPKWQSHISEDRPCKRVKFDLGSICSAVEGKEHVEFEI